MNSININKKGLFIAIEGSDGSGKATQVAKLLEKLEQSGYQVATFDFPQYGKESAHFVTEYLNGVYGDLYGLGPYTPSYFYALDRFAAKQAINEALAEGKVVIANRFTASNMAHQGAKFDRREERIAFFKWIENLEFQTMQIPKPDLNVVLTVPAAVSQKLVDKKQKRDYTAAKRDLHESDLDYLKRSVATFKDLVTTYPNSFTEVECARDNKILEVYIIHNLIWERIVPQLPKPLKKANPSPKKDGKLPKKTSPFITKNDNGSYSISPLGKEYLSEAVTNTEGSVYAFSGKLSPITVAAGMARLSRRADDMRITILDEFAGKEGKDASLLKRVITAYGDDSVQQLAGVHVVVENASNLLTKKLEWGRLGAYLEQSTRYIYYDQKDERGNYRYYTPTTLNAQTARKYEETIDKIFGLYSEMVRGLSKYVRDCSTVPEKDRDGAWKGATRAQACDAIRPVLPVATKSTVGMFMSGQAIESLIMHLQSDLLQEAKDSGQAILEETRKIIPMFLERADKPDRGGAAVAYRANTYAAVREKANTLLKQSQSNDQETRLVNVWPRNELDLVPHMLYEHSNLSLKEIEEQVADWTYDQKMEVMNSYIGERLNRRHKPGRALEQAHYSWDIICDYGNFRDLQRHRMVDDLQWQELTPRFGYDVPKLVEEAGLTEQFEKCFDLSYKLYSELQAAGYELEAQYATLFGHKMRWKIMYNARQAFHLHELRTAPQGHPGYRKLVKEMHDRIAEEHPELAKAMTFVNQDEDPELTRLAAERYTQYKLDQLDKQKK